MITATEDGAFRVSCTEADCPRPLMRIVASAAHAGNLERKHEREFHGGGEADEKAEMIDVIRSGVSDWDSWDLRDFVEAIADALIAAGYAKPPM